MTQKFTKDGEEFEGVQWEVTIESEEEIADFTGARVIPQELEDSVILEFSSFGIHLDAGDWILRNKDGAYKAFRDLELKQTFDLPIPIVTLERSVQSSEIEKIKLVDLNPETLTDSEDDIITWLYALSTDMPLDEYIQTVKENLIISKIDEAQPQIASESEYYIVSDNSGHEYVIPFDKKTDWNTWLEIPEDDDRSWEEPEYAERIDGGGVIFKQYRLG